MLTKHNCHIIEDTAIAIGCLSADVFYMALASKGGEVNVARVNELYARWMENKSISTEVENFCLDILSLRVVILDQYKYLKAKRKDVK